MSDTEAVLHGYTMARLDRLARTAAYANRRWLGPVAPAQAAEQAWEAIVTLLCEATDPPTERMLLDAAWKSIRLESAQVRATHGMSNTDTDAYTPAFATYWYPLPDNFENVLVDRLALPQAWGALRQYHRDTFVAYVEAGYNKARAAELLGIGRQAMHKRIALGYAEFAAMWYGDEPIPPRGDDRDTGWERPDQRDPGRPNSIQNLRREAA